MEGAATIIQNLGFPIACVMACMYYIFKFTDEERKENARREERSYQQMDKFSKSLDNFNETLIKIDTRLEVVESKLTRKETNEKY